MVVLDANVELVVFDMVQQVVDFEQVVRCSVTGFFAHAWEESGIEQKSDEIVCFVRSKGVFSLFIVRSRLILGTVGSNARY